MQADISKLFPCVKNVRIWSFSAFGPNTAQENSENWHFLSSVYNSSTTDFIKKHVRQLFDIMHERVKKF